jgi:hypothetical protein
VLAGTTEREKQRHPPRRNREENKTQTRGLAGAECWRTSISLVVMDATVPNIMNTIAPCSSSTQLSFLAPYHSPSKTSFHLNSPLSIHHLSSLSSLPFPPSNHQPHSSISSSLSLSLTDNSRSGVPEPRSGAPYNDPENPHTTKPSLSLKHNRETPSSYLLTIKCLTSLPSSPTAKPQSHIPEIIPLQ